MRLMRRDEDPMIRLTGGMTFDNPSIPNIPCIRQCKRAIGEREDTIGI